MCAVWYIKQQHRRNHIMYRATLQYDQRRRSSGRLVTLLVVHHKAVLMCTLYNVRFTYRNLYNVVRAVRSAEGQRRSSGRLVTPWATSSFSSRHTPDAAAILPTLPLSQSGTLHCHNDSILLLLTSQSRTLHWHGSILCWCCFSPHYIAIVTGGHYNFAANVLMLLLSPGCHH